MRGVDAVLVDTDVFSVVFVREDSTESRLAAWREDLRDRRVVISFQTRAEMLAGCADAWLRRDERHASSLDSRWNPDRP